MAMFVVLAGALAIAVSGQVQLLPPQNPSPFQALTVPTLSAAGLAVADGLFSVCMARLPFAVLFDLAA